MPRFLCVALALLSSACSLEVKEVERFVVWRANLGSVVALGSHITVGAHISERLQCKGIRCGDNSSSRPVRDVRFELDPPGIFEMGAVSAENTVELLAVATGSVAVTGFTSELEGASSMVQVGAGMPNDVSVRWQRPTCPIDKTGQGPEIAALPTQLPLIIAVTAKRDALAVVVDGGIDLEAVGTDIEKVPFGATLSAVSNPGWVTLTAASIPSWTREIRVFDLAEIDRLVPIVTPGFPGHYRIAFEVDGIEGCLAPEDFELRIEAPDAGECEFYVGAAASTRTATATVNGRGPHRIGVHPGPPCSVTVSAPGTRAPDLLLDVPLRR